MTLKLFLAAAIMLILNDHIVADDWPQFGGQNRDGISRESGLLQTWPAEGPTAVWQANDVGSGFSSLAVVGNKIFTIGDLANGQFVFALSRTSGKHIWKQRIGEANKTSYKGSRSTPTFVDGMLFVMSTNGDVVCLSADDGTVQWKKSLEKEFSGNLMLAMGQYQWQYSESPLVDGDLVIVTPGATDAAIVALNKSNGDTIWRTKLPDSLGDQGADGAGYSSMVAAEIDGTRQYIQLFGRGVIAVDASSGKYLWGYNRVANNIANVSSPVVTGNQIFVSTGYQTGSALLEIKKNGDKWAVDEKFFLSSRVFQNHHGGFVLKDGHIYGGHGHKLGLPICLDLKAGNLAWGPKRNSGKGSASIALADGHIYLRYENGLMVLVEATPAGYNEKGSFMIPDVKAKSWSRPVISGGQLFLKEQDTLHCYQISDASKKP